MAGSLVKSFIGQLLDRGRSLSTLTDEELVKRCQQNDHQAFRALVDRYKHRIHWLVRRMVGGPDAEDLTQDVFLRVYQAMPNFQGRSSFKTWIYRIAHNLCITELKKRGRRGEHLSIEEEGEEKVHWLMPESHGGLEEEIEKRDLSNSVWNLVDELPTPYRTALTLFYVQQARYEEIAEIMNIPMGTVKTYIRRGRLRLRDLMLAQPDIAGIVGEAAQNGPAAENGPAAGHSSGSGGPIR